MTIYKVTVERSGKYDGEYFVNVDDRRAAVNKIRALGLQDGDRVIVTSAFPFTLYNGDIIKGKYVL